MLNTNPQWYVFSTYPRSEKIVYDDLLRRKYDSFLPLSKTMNTWKNRQKKIIYKILFPGYIFVKTIESEIYKVLQIPKISACVKCGNAPSIISEKDIASIRLMLQSENDISLVHDFNENDHVRIIQGPLKGYEGILMKQNGNHRFGIQIKAINQVVTFSINISIIEKIDLGY